MGALDRFYVQPSEQVFFRSGDGVVRFPGATKSYGAVLDLISQAAEVITGLENCASEAERATSENLEQAQKRIEQLETELRSAQNFIGEARVKLKASDDAARVERSRLEVAQRKVCELEMRARTAEAQAKENMEALGRVEEAIRTQLLAKLLPSNKLT